MIIHIFNMVKMGLGIILLFFAVILWSLFKKFSSALLALTAILLYVLIVLDLLDFYSVVNIKRVLVYQNIPLLQHVKLVIFNCQFSYYMI
jgi:hypothetical protein